MPIAGLRQVTALRRGAEQPFATIRVGRSGRLRHRAWEGQGSAGRHERAALLRGKRAGCGNANFLRKKAACLDAARQSAVPLQDRDLESDLPVGMYILDQPKSVGLSI